MLFSDKLSLLRENKNFRLEGFSMWQLAMDKQRREGAKLSRQAGERVKETETGANPKEGR